jgi:uncharacterized surface protein with fasciclin (FAS1) repeats
MKADRETELDAGEQQSVGVVKHGRSLRKSPCPGLAAPVCIYFRRRRFVTSMQRILPCKSRTHVFKGLMKNLIDAASQVGNFHILLSAFKSASLIDMLRSPGQYTIFAPTDAAFKRLPAGSLEALLKDSRALKPFLCNHMMVGVKAANDILPGELQPLEGKSLRASLDGSAIMINRAQIVQADIRANNGVIHAIDDVLVPLNPILASVA